MNRPVQSAIKFIEDNLCREITLTEIAQSVNLSSSRLRHAFKVETGMSLLQYVKSLRMQKAKILLENSHLMIKQITAEIGVNDQSHFVRDFKKYFGLTPTQYRELYLIHNKDLSNIASSANK
jgi:two-component system, response regulator YesN